MDHAVLHAFFLTLLAGLSTGIGSCIAFLTHHTNKKFLSVSLGFSAGVMIYVSMIEIFSQAQDALQAELGEKWGSWSTVIAFFGGMLLIALIDKCIPSEENPHEVKSFQRASRSRFPFITPQAPRARPFGTPSSPAWLSLWAPSLGGCSSCPL